MACLVQAPGTDLKEDQVIAFCKEHLASFKCPKAVVFMDMLPRNAAGKVLKTKLREMA